jgi:hypothetical protein
MRIGVVIAAAAFGDGCYQPSPAAPCTLTCDQANPCPDNLECGADHLCQSPGAGTCAAEAGIFRSVGPANASALATGSGNRLVIRGSRATFAAPIPDRIGVGDALQYDTDDDGIVDALAFVHGRVSATELVVASATGGAPVPTTAADEEWSMYRAYLSLRAASNGNRNGAIAIDFDGWANPPDLVALGKSWHIACYGDGPDTLTAAFRDWGTSETTYLRIFTPTEASEVGTSQRHAGVWDTTKYRLETSGVGSNDLALTLEDVFARVDGLQIFVNTEGGTSDLPWGINLEQLGPTKRAYVSNNIVRSSDVATANSFTRGIRITATAEGPIVYVWNNFVYDLGGVEEARGIETAGPGTTVFLFNNTFVDVYPAIYTNNANDLLTIKNTIMLACGGNCIGGPGTIMGTNNVGQGFDTRGVGMVPASDVVTDYLRADDDLRLNPDAPRASELIDRGANLTADPALAFDRDIGGQERGETWDIGADEH